MEMADIQALIDAQRNKSVWPGAFGQAGASVLTGQRMGPAQAIASFLQGLAGGYHGGKETQQTGLQALLKQKMDMEKERAQIDLIRSQIAQSGQKDITTQMALDKYMNEKRVNENVDTSAGAMFTTPQDQLQADAGGGRTILDILKGNIAQDDKKYKTLIQDPEEAARKTAKDEATAEYNRMKSEQTEAYRDRQLDLSERRTAASERRADATERKINEKDNSKKSAAQTAYEDADVAIATLRNAYDRLEKGGGITSTNKAATSNIIASASSSPVGQLVGKVLGTKNQSARNDITMGRPALLAALMKATGMNARQMDSNAELKLWITTATDPTLDVGANRRALENIEKKYLRARGDQVGGSGTDSSGLTPEEETELASLRKRFKK